MSTDSGHRPSPSATHTSPPSSLFEEAWVSWLLLSTWLSPPVTESPEDWRLYDVFIGIGRVFPDIKSHGEQRYSEAAMASPARPSATRLRNEYFVK